ncbi:MAG TPA: flavin reductase family protein [Bacteroidia bacterium]|nr:flavin reductase family protein [Bacteroidia bacterium]HNS13068.1 flavin reductase family protein [Bacteroidia bacterium]
MLKIKPGEIKTALFHSYLLASIAPRPIAFASTVDKNGVRNLAPFSFFNAFGSKPPILVFSPARRVRDNTIKHTLENIQETGEVVINAVNFDMVQQMSLASTEYPKGIDEFIKSGLTPIASELVKPFRVKESPVQMECKVLEVKPMGTEGGAANLIICEVLLLHINEGILNSENKIDPHKIDLVARMGDNFYCRASGSSIFEVTKPLTEQGIGVDQIPERIRLSKILTGNNLGQLGNCKTLPSKKEVDDFAFRIYVKELRDRYGKSPEVFENKLHELAQALLAKGEVNEAWITLLYSNSLFIS